MKFKFSIIFSLGLCAFIASNADAQIGRGGIIRRILNRDQPDPVREAEERREEVEKAQRAAEKRAYDARRAAQREAAEREKELEMQFAELNRERVLIQRLRAEAGLNPNPTVEAPAMPGPRNLRNELRLGDSGLNETANKASAFGMTLVRIPVIGEGTANAIQNSGIVFQIESIQPNSDADIAGLEPGDQLSSAAGMPLDSLGAFAGLKDILKPGDTVEIKFTRDGRPKVAQLRYEFASAEVDPTEMFASPVGAIETSSKTRSSGGGSTELRLRPDNGSPQLNSILENDDARESIKPESIEGLRLDLETEGNQETEGNPTKSNSDDESNKLSLNELRQKVEQLIQVTKDQQAIIEHQASEIARLKQAKP